MSSELVGQVQYAPVGSLDRFVLTVLADGASDCHRVAWSSLHHLCTRTGLSRAQLRESLARLRDQRIIDVAPDSLVPPSFRKPANVSRVIRPVEEWLTPEQVAG